jgi:hypothetical protein
LYLLFAVTIAAAVVCLALPFIVFFQSPRSYFDIVHVDGAYWKAHLGYWFYYLSVVGFSITAFLFAIGAFLIRSRPVVSNASLIVAGIVAGWIACDVWLIRRGFETFAAGGNFTDLNWAVRHVAYDADGCWERPTGAGSPETPEILFLGDSFTFGWGMLDQSKRFTRVVESALAAQGQRWFVRNCGVPGSDTVDERKFFSRLRKTAERKYVVVGYLVNDIRPLRTEPMPAQPSVGSGFWVQLARANPTLSAIYARASIGQLGDWVTQLFRNTADAYLDDDALAAHVADMAGLAADIRAAGSKPVIAILPYPHFWIALDPGMRARILDRIRSGFATLDAETVDLAELETVLPLARFAINGYDPHPSAEAHDLIGTAFAREFLRIAPRD